MKKILFFGLAFFTYKSYAQTWYSATDIQVFKGGYYAMNFTSHKLSDRVSAFLFTSIQPGYADVAPGVSFSSNLVVHPKAYWEVGVAPGITLSKDKEEGSYYYAQMYGYLETKPDYRLAQGKWCIQLVPAYVFNVPDHHWVTGTCFVTYAITKNIVLGLYYQTDLAQGVRAEYDFAIKKTAWVIKVYAITGERVTGGLAAVFQK